jgi:hypothetical protein
MRITAVFVFLFALCSAAQAEPPTAMWVDARGDRLFIELSSLPPDDVAKIHKWLDSAESPETDEDGYILYPKALAEVKLPTKAGDEWTILSPEGQSKATVETILLGRGASEYHIIAKAKTAKVPDGVLLGFPPGATVKPQKLTAPAAVTEKLAKEARKRFTKELTKAAAPKAAKAAAAAGGRPKAFERFAGKFADGAEEFVTFEVKKKNQFPDVERLTGAVFAKRDGSITHAYYPPDFRIDRVTLLAVVDLEGDGFDELVVCSHYYEGSYYSLVFWDGKTWQSRGLAGDGA